MGAAAALDYTYRYQFASEVTQHERGLGLHLATCGANHEHPHFFEGKLRRPRCIADMLLVLTDVVRTHFFMPRVIQFDPVVTSNESMLRFEGFSGCCGVYARADLLPEAFESDLQGRGTTNVDFNDPMRASLLRLQDTEDIRLAVGQDEVVLERQDNKVVEKKVKLPIRWIKGFSEVGAYQQVLKPKVEMSAVEGRRFLRSLPTKGTTKQPTYLVKAGRSMRLSPRHRSGAIRLQGTQRLGVIERLLGSADTLRIWADDESSVSGWEVIFDIGRFFLLISPELYRGFSGEGQVLEKLAVGNWEDALSSVQAHLSWQSQIDTVDLARKTGYSSAEIDSTLAVLGSRGLTGYDVSTGSHFHRVLPFELEKVEQLQPRLVGAKKLVAEGLIDIVTMRDSDTCECVVSGTGVKHTVHITPEKNKCTCPWFSKYLGQRGPCKHILAAQIVMEDKEQQSQ